MKTSPAETGGEPIAVQPQSVSSGKTHKDYTSCNLNIT
jgi:hypothetical protein